MLRALTTLLPALLLACSLPAQEDLGVHFLRGSWAAYQTNPALITDGRYNVMLPQGYADFYLSDLDYATVVTRDREGGALLDSRAILASLDEENVLRQNQALGTLGLAWRPGRWWFSVQHAWRERGLALYPHTLPQLIWSGNGNHLGETLDVSTTADLAQWHDWSVGAAYQLAEGLDLGLRLHLLSGVYHLGIDRPGASISTDETTYELSLDADFLLNSSGGFYYHSFDSVSLGYRPVNADGGAMFGPNLGFALDAGAAYARGPWQAALSVTGMGRVRWQEAPKNYRVEGQKVFAGMEVLDSLFAGSNTLGSVVDSLNEALGVVESDEPYTSRSPVRLYASLGYRLNDRWSVGALFFHEWWLGRGFPAAALSGTFRPAPWAEVGATYAYRAESWDNLGLNLQLRAGALRIVAATDSVLGLLRWKNASSGNLHLGFNLVFGGKALPGAAGERP